MSKIILNLPIRTVSESNCSEHWSVKSKRHRQQQFFIRLLLITSKPEIILPCKITLIRISPRLLDDDNLVGSLKYIRDEISAYINPEKVVKCKKINKNNKIVLYENKGHADNDKNITWAYAQKNGKTYTHDESYAYEKGKMYIRIEIESAIDVIDNAIS